MIGLPSLHALDHSQGPRIWLAADAADMRCGFDRLAERFSVLLRTGGRFRLTPLYDVISAQPSVDSKQVLWKDFRLAMSFGTKPNYAMRQIAPRHFFQTADKAGIGKDVVPSIIEELCGETALAVDRVNADLPAGFPGKLADSISNGIGRRLRVLEASSQDESPRTSAYV